MQGLVLWRPACVIHANRDTAVKSGMNEAQINATTNPAAGLTQAAEREDRRVLRLVLFDALASEAMGTFTTGVFLVGFAVALGADNFAIGMLAAVPFFAQLLQIPAVLLVERWRVRRAGRANPQSTAVCRPLHEADDGRG
jgi:hypothetical protein